MPQHYCELELRISRLHEGSYKLDARFLNPASDIENELVEQEELYIDTAQLRDAVLDVERYGELLTEMVFGGPHGPLRAALSKAKTAAGAFEGLRLRLNIQRNAKELQAVRWESLLDPESHTPLLVQERLWFARFLNSDQFDPQSPADPTEMRILVVIADPHDSESKWGLAHIDRDQELQRIRRAIQIGTQNATKNLTMDVLNGPATSAAIILGLRAKHVDILYLICHGGITVDNKARLLLEDEDRKSKFTDGKELVEQLRDMKDRPRLIVMASCASAGNRDAEALTAIGPQLAIAGVPAIIAMQGDISQVTTSRFMTKLFEELSRTGRIDQAMALARSAVRDRPDWWMPVLFMRLKSGRLWPAFSGITPFDRWDGIVSEIEHKRCVPILGAGLVESAWGGMHGMARKWAQRHEFPLAPRDWDNLALVAQYIDYQQGRSEVFSTLTHYMVSYFRERSGLNRTEVENDNLATADDQDLSVTLNKWLTKIAQKKREADVGEPHRLLANIPFPIYINANRDNFLRDALIAANRTPEVYLCTWATQNDMPRHIGPQLPEGYEPTPNNPLILQVFGNLEHPDSLVLTEDDYFDFLMAVTRNDHSRTACIPNVVSSALARSGLLMLGFQPDDWDLRTLLKGILKQPGSSMSRRCTRVAVQMSLSDESIIDPERASQYFQRYFKEHDQLETFWGSAQDFLIKLEERYRARRALANQQDEQ
jgi:hypothetical protein